MNHSINQLLNLAKLASTLKTFRRKHILSLNHRLAKLAGITPLACQGLSE